jgi:(p)ppGpp synthase/HD superfamily hydrolase
VFDVGTLSGVDLADRARQFGADVYGSREAPEHPLEVARLVRESGADEETVAAAVLHDVLEDTDVDPGEIEAKFGSRVAALVRALTEDESIADYEQRKDEHRRRVAAAGRDAALIFVADKLSNARRMRRNAKEPDMRKIAHYAATLELMRSRYPDLPLLDELDEVLRGLRSDLQRTPA